MKLKLKTLTFMGGALVCLLVVVILSTANVFLDSFSSLEREFATDNIKRLNKAIEDETERIKSISLDWSQWDDTYKFLAGNNPEYVEKNLQAQAIANLKLDFLLFLDKAGNPLYASLFSPATKSKSEMPQEYINDFKSIIGLFSAGKTDASVQGITVIDERPLLFSACPATTSDLKEPANGTLVFGRFMDKSFIFELKKLLNQEVKLELTDSKKLPNDFKKAQKIIGYQTPEFISTIDKETICGYVILKNINNENKIIIRVDMQRKISQHGLLAVFTMTVWIIITGLVFCILSFFMFEKIILARIRRLTGCAELIRETADLAERVPVTGKDEISDLENEFNNMLMMLEKNKTNQQFAEIAMVNNEKRYQLIIEQAPIGIVTCYLDGRFRTVNNGYCNMVGYTAEELLAGRAIKDITPEEDWKEEKEKINLFAEKNTPPSEYEKRYRTKTGKIIYAYVRATIYRDLLGDPQYIICTALDITEKKIAEEELIKSQMLLSYSLNQLNAGIIITDPEGKFQLVNSTMVSIFEKPAEEIEDSSIDSIEDWKFMTPDGVKLAHDEIPLVKACKKGETTTGLLLCVKNKQDVERWFIANSAPVYNRKSEIFSAVAVFSEITDHIETQKKHKDLEAQLRQAQQIESLGRLAGGFAHDLNNFLVPILGYSDIIISTLNSTSEFYSPVSEIHNAAEKAKNLAQKFLALSSKQMLETKSMSINDLIESFAGILQRLIREDIVMEYKFARDIWMVKGDPAQLEQVIMNLAINAKDAMPSGGRLIIETKNESFMSEMPESQPSLKPGNYVLISISDTGTGITEEVRKHIFEPFFTTKERGKGTGLGLSIVHGIIHQHGGAISILSELGHGTTFNIYLPRFEGKTTDEISAVPKEETADSAKTEGKTILVVEDEPIVLRMVSSELKTAGYNVLTAENGKEALALAAKHDGRIDVLLTDVIMPYMDGKELHDNLEKIRPETKVLFMSGHTYDVLSRHDIRAPDTQFISKPFSMKTLKAKLRLLMAPPQNAQKSS